MSDWDSNPDVFCQHGVVWSGITHREQTGHHTFDSDGLVCVFHVNLEGESRLCLKNRKWNHLFLSFGSCFWAATAKDAGIYCLVKEYLSYTTFPSALWDIKCPKYSDLHNPTKWHTPRLLISDSFGDSADRGHFHPDRIQVALAARCNPFSYHQLLNASHRAFTDSISTETFLGVCVCVCGCGAGSFVLVLLSASEISIFIMLQFHSFIEMISGRH